MDADRPHAPRLVVVGGVSVDRISTPQLTGVQVLGGGGLYAALGAATRTTVGLAGICSDHPLAAARPWRGLLDDTGLITLPGRGLSFDISYDGDGRATYRTDNADDEQHVRLEQLPPMYRTAPGFHLCALGDAATQLRYALGLRSQTPTRTARISAGTFLARIVAARHAVLDLLDSCGLFTCSALEAAALTGLSRRDDVLAWLAGTVVAPGRAVVVTEAASGCHVVTGGVAHHVPAYPSLAIDPTGAGEAFAGAFAACVVEDDDVLTAARYASAVASLVVEGFGATALLNVAPQVLAARAAALAGSVIEVGS